MFFLLISMFSVWNWQNARDNICYILKSKSWKWGQWRCFLQKINNEGEKSYTCNKYILCEKQLDNFSMRSHLKMHDGEKSYKCNQCDYASSQTGNLRRHLKAHSGEKPNKCKQCDFSSSQASNLRTHLKTHSGQKSNKCNQCDFASSHAGNLRRHLKMHTIIIICVQCDHHPDDDHPHLCTMRS